MVLRHALPRAADCRCGPPCSPLAPRVFGNAERYDEAALHVVLRCGGALGSGIRFARSRKSRALAHASNSSTRSLGRVFPIHNALGLNSSNTRERNTAASDATLSVLDNAAGCKSRHRTCAPVLLMISDSC